MWLLERIKRLLICISAFIIFFYILSIMPNLPTLNNTQFISYKSAPIKPLTGSLSLNTKLNNAEYLFQNLFKGPESIVYHDGIIYAGVHGGFVLKIVGETVDPFVKFGKSCDGQHEEHICGRPLGMFIKRGSLYVADAYYGIFRVNITTKEVVQLVSPDLVIEGRQAKLFNGITVDSADKIYWTDSDSELDLRCITLIGLGSGSGRLIKYDPVTKKNTVLVDKIHFANGVALSADESFIVVTESMRNRILKYQLKGPEAGIATIFIDGLPGVPDNIKMFNGHFYVSFPTPVDADHPLVLNHKIGEYPNIRKSLAQFIALLKLFFSSVDNIFPNLFLKKINHKIAHYELLESVVPREKRSTIVKLSEHAEIVDSLHALDGRIKAISEIEFIGDYAYLASPINSFIARVKLNKVN